jgi:tRNA 2-thiouridine synthesizing protein D
MKFSLLVLGAPYSTQSVNTALRFAEAAINADHDLYRVFFYHDGVNCANSLITPSQDEANIPSEWQRLAHSQHIDLVVCVASALKRGVLDNSEAERYEKNSGNLADSFDISGLGQLVDAAINSDRVITFGP